MRYSENILSVTAKLHCSFLVSMNAPLLHTAQYLKGWRQNFGLIRIKRASSQLLCNCITKGDDEWRAANWQKLWQHSFSSISLSWITSLRKQQDNWSHYIWDTYKCLNYKKKEKKRADPTGFNTNPTAYSPSQMPAIPLAMVTYMYIWDWTLFSSHFEGKVRYLVDVWSHIWFRF